MWYNRVVQDISCLPDCIAYYDNELAQAKKECAISGSLEKIMAQLPGITESRFSQLQEVEAILNFMNIQLRKIKRYHFQKYMENYNRVLSSRDAEKYVEGESEVVDYEILINEIAFIRNKYLGIIKAFESKNYMLSNHVRLKVVGLDDASI